MTKSLLDLVASVDSSPYETDRRIWYLKSHDGFLLGKVPPYVVERLPDDLPMIRKDEEKKMLTVCQLGGVSERSEAFAKLCQYFRSQKIFVCCEGWRNELYGVYTRGHQLYFTIERSCACLFGLTTYGVHITGYVPANRPEDYKIWVPRRSYTKPTWPGMLDNTVAGGLGYPAGMWDTAIKECGEEAGLSSDYVQNHLRQAGVVTYEFQKINDVYSEDSVFQPEVECVYDLVMSPGVVPKPTDGEVHSFELLSVPEVRELLGKGEFKYNCALILIDFLIRHGIVNYENEPDYLQIVCRSHRKLEYPLL